MQFTIRPKLENKHRLPYHVIFDYFGVHEIILRDFLLSDTSQYAHSAVQRKIITKNELAVFTLNNCFRFYVRLIICRHILL